MAKFSFQRDFQIQIIGLLYQDFEFLLLGHDIIASEYFCDNVLAWFFETIRDYYLDYQMRIDEVSLKNEIKKAAKAGEIKKPDYEGFVKVFAQIQETVPNSKYIADEIVTFCKHQAIRKAAMEIPDLLNNNEFDAIAKVMGNALAVGDMNADLGIQYFSSFTQRIAYRAEMQERRIFPTGITPLDTYIGGGLKAGQLGIWMAPTNRGKCHSLGTEVLANDGSFVKVEDVKKGDLLMGPDGSPRKVLGTTRGRGALYRITPKRGGEPFECNADHILTLYDRLSDSVVDVPLDTYLEWSKDRKRLSRLVRSSGVTFSPVDDPVVDPWFLGVWYADGTKNLNTVSITNPDQEIIDSVAAYAAVEGLNATVRATSASNPCPFVSITGEGYGKPNHLLNKVRDLYGDGIRLPLNYLRGSEETRKAFLAGLIDGDGYCGNSGRIDLVQKRKQWADDIAYLARSLGYRVSLREKKVRLPGWGKHRSYWRLTIVGDTSDLPIRLSRKHCHPRKQWSHVGFRVEPIKSGEYAGFELDGDSRYLLRDFTVTHNSVALVHCGKRTVIYKQNVLFYTLELEEEEVAERYDASFTGVKVNDLVDYEDVVASGIDELGRKHGNSLLIKSFPTKTATVDTLRAHLKQCLSVGFVPDLICVDYLDLMKSHIPRREKREELTDITEGLKGLAGEMKIPIWTATQSRRAAVAKETHGEDDVAEDWGKMFTADIVITINQTQEEAGNNQIRLYIAKNRNGPRAVEVKGIDIDFARMVFYKPFKEDPNAGAANKKPGKAVPPKRRPGKKAPGKTT